MSARFPVGGERHPVYAFLRDHGYIMSEYSDKHWTRPDGLKLHLYGTGSMALIRDADGRLVADAPLEDAVLAAGKGAA